MLNHRANRRKTLVTSHDVTQLQASESLLEINFREKCLLIVIGSKRHWLNKHRPLFGIYIINSGTLISTWRD